MSGAEIIARKNSAAYGAVNSSTRKSGASGRGSREKNERHSHTHCTRKKLTATAPAQIIGTYSTESGTFLWAWDHPSVLAPLQEHARRVRDYGEEHGVADLTTRKLECEELQAWEFTALACHLCGGQGAYRGPAGPTLVFMTFGEVTLSQPKGKHR
jgi:hypothetical protein